MIGSATFSPCELYRYTLSRKIELVGDHTEKHIVFAMLNPSKATAEVSDPTVSKCCTYARLWGYANLTVVNIFAYRSTDPKALTKIDDPVGPDNDHAIMSAAKYADMVLCAWGRHGDLNDRGRIVAGMLHAQEIKLHYLHLNNDGSPSHPLYQRLDLEPQLWTEVEEYGRAIH